MSMKRGKFIAIVVAAVVLLSLVAIPLSAGKSPKLKLERTDIDLGVVYNKQPTLDFVIKFTNGGREQLRITEIRSSCPCLSTEYPRGMIAKGQKGEIKATLDLRAFTAGNFEKKLQIFSNSSKEPQVIVVHGEYKYAQ